MQNGIQKSTILLMNCTIMVMKLVIWNQILLLTQKIQKLSIFKHQHVLVMSLAAGIAHQVFTLTTKYIVSLKVQLEIEHSMQNGIRFPIQFIIMIMIMNLIIMLTVVFINMIAYGTQEKVLQLHFLDYRAQAIIS